jgi:hypothetical protein
MSEVAEAELPTFNYDALEMDPPAIAKLRSIAVSIRQSGHDAFLETGHQLIEVKPWFAHGDFTEWVEHECGIGIRQAQKAMQAAQVVAKAPNLAHLSIDALLALAAKDKLGGDNKGVPKRILTKLGGMIEEGNVPTAAAVRALLSPKAQASKKQAASAARAGAETKATTPPKADGAPLPAGYTLLNVLIATWNDADEECRRDFRQHIGCTCGGKQPEEPPSVN